MPSPIPLVEPVTGEILGYEATYLGRARVTAEAGLPSPDAAPGDSDKARLPVPASLTITAAKMEIGKGKFWVYTERGAIMAASRAACLALAIPCLEGCPGTRPGAAQKRETKARKTSA